MIVMIGSSHHSAPVALRERLALPPEEIGPALERLVKLPEIDEALILSTCNRVEIVAHATRTEAAAAAIRGFLTRERGVEARDLDRYTYCRHGNDAVRHLFSVTSGLDSMILGEPQIVGQVKQAYETGRAHGATGPFLDRLLQYCFSVSKRVRTETGISRNAVSVAYAAVELARNIFGALEGRRALLVGSGKMSSLVARHLVARGVADIVVASRNFDHAAALAAECGGRPVHWDEGLTQLADVDIVVSCTHAAQFVLTRDAVAVAARRRRGQPLFLIDIAVPRDIDPAANELDNVYLYDIDGLQGVVDSNREERRQASEEAARLIDAEVLQFDRWRQSREVTPMIVALREALHGVAEGELRRVRRRHGPTAAEHNAALEELSRAIVQKILHRPIRHLRNAVQRGEVDSCVSLYGDLFGVVAPRPRASRAQGGGAKTAGEAPAADSEEEDTKSGAGRGPRLVRGRQEG